MPVLYGDRFVGRIEAVAEKKTGVLTVKNIWFEEGIKQTKKLALEMERCVRRFAKFNDCKEIMFERSLLDSKSDMI